MFQKDDIRMLIITLYGFAIIPCTDVNPTIYGSDSCTIRTSMIRNTDLIFFKIRI